MDNLHQGFSVGASVVCAELVEEMVLLDAETGKYFGLDAVGTRIWHLTTAGAHENEIVDALLSEYDVDRNSLQADVSRFLQQLSERELLSSRKS